MFGNEILKILGSFGVFLGCSIGSEIVAYSQGKDAAEAVDLVVTVKIRTEVGVQIDQFDSATTEGRPSFSILLRRLTLGLTRSAEFNDRYVGYVGLGSLAASPPSDFVREFGKIALQTVPCLPAERTAGEGSTENDASPLSGESLRFVKGGDSRYRQTSVKEKPVADVLMEGVRDDLKLLLASAAEYLAPGDGRKVSCDRLGSLFAIGGEFAFQPAEWKRAQPVKLDKESYERARGRGVEKALELAFWGVLTSGIFEGEASVAPAECDDLHRQRGPKTCLDVTFDVASSASLAERLRNVYAWRESVQPSESLPKIPGLRVLDVDLRLKGVAHLVVDAESGVLERVEVCGDVEGVIEMDNYVSFMGYEWDGETSTLAFSGSLQHQTTISRAKEVRQIR